MIRARSPCIQAIASPSELEVSREVGERGVVKLQPGKKLLPVDSFPQRHPAGLGRVVYDRRVCFVGLLKGSAHLSRVGELRG